MPTDEPNEAERTAHALEGVNAGYVAEMQEQSLRDPASVDPEWRALFQPRIPPMSDGPPAAAPTGTTPVEPAPAAAPAPATSEAAASTLPAGAPPPTGPAARLAPPKTASPAGPTATTFLR